MNQQAKESAIQQDAVDIVNNLISLRARLSTELGGASNEVERAYIQGEIDICESIINAYKHVLDCLEE